MEQRTWIWRTACRSLWILIPSILDGSTARVEQIRFSPLMGCHHFHQRFMVRFRMFWISWSRILVHFLLTKLVELLIPWGILSIFEIKWCFCKWTSNMGSQWISTRQIIQLLYKIMVFFLKITSWMWKIVWSLGHLVRLIDEKMLRALSLFKDSSGGGILAQVWVPMRLGNQHILSTCQQPYLLEEMLMEYLLYKICKFN